MGENRIRIANNQRGFTLLEVALAMVIMGIIVSGMFHFMRIGATEVQMKFAAMQMRQVIEAAGEYAKANYTTLVASATPSTSTTVSVATLKTGNYLPASFQNKNPWGQSYTVYVTEPSAGDLQVLVLTTGGKGNPANEPDFANLTIPGTATMIGAAGGHAPTGVLTGQTPTTLLGAFGGWSFNLTTTDIPGPGAGHLAGLLYLDDGALGKDYLYRVQIPGQPELNQMFTTLDMGGNQILMGDADVGGGDGEGVASVNFENHVAADFPACAAGDDQGGRMFYQDSDGIYVCRMGSWELLADTGNSAFFRTADMVAHNSVVTKPVCPSAAPTPQIFLGTAMFSENNLYREIKAVQTWATDLGASWRVNLRVLTREGYTNPTSTYGKVLVITKCT